tara:strand:+ start:68 stop:286 length:219 start_codon:yes stop_codon:yes gene_type:complete
MIPPVWLMIFVHAAPLIGGETNTMHAAAIEKIAFETMEQCQTFEEELRSNRPIRTLGSYKFKTFCIKVPPVN